MKLVFDIYDIDPLDKLVGTGPDDERGIPTVTAEDFAKAKTESESGKKWYFGRAQYFSDKDEGREISYLLPPGYGQPDGVKNVLEALVKHTLESGILKTES